MNWNFTIESQLFKEKQLDAEKLFMIIIILNNYILNYSKCISWLSMKDQHVVEGS